MALYKFSLDSDASDDITVFTQINAPLLIFGRHSRGAFIWKGCRWKGGGEVESGGCGILDSAYCWYNKSVHNTGSNSLILLLVTWIP